MEAPSHGDGLSWEEHPVIDALKPTCKPRRISRGFVHPAGGGDPAFKLKGTERTDFCTALEGHRAQLAQQMQDWMAREEKILQRFLQQGGTAGDTTPGKVLSLSPMYSEDNGCGDMEDESGGGYKSVQSSVRQDNGCGDTGDESGGGYKSVQSSAPQAEGLSVSETQQPRLHSGDDAVSSARSRTRRFSLGSGRMSVDSANGLASITDDDLEMKLEAYAVADGDHMGFHSRARTGSFSTWRHRNFWKGKLQDVVASIHFEVFFAIIIVLNSISIGVEVDYTVSHPETPGVFAAVQHGFTTLFTVELVMRMVAEGRQFFSGYNWAWNLFDAFVVATSLFEAAVDVWHRLGHETPDNIGNASNLRIIRIIRTTRIIRIFRITRILRFVRALRTLVYSIICTVKSLIWVVLLLVMITYVFGILFTQGTHEYLTDCAGSQGCDGDGELERYWGSIITSMFTLFQSISDGLSWDAAVQPLGRIHTMWVGIFTVFIAFVYFAVLNVVTGVFVQSAIESAQRDHDMFVQGMQAKQEMHMEKIKELFKLLDANDSGCITLHQFDRHIGDEQVQAYLASLEIDTLDAWRLFKLLDTTGDHKVDLEEFVMGSLRIRGSAKSIDLATLIYEHRCLARKFSSFVNMLDVQESQLTEGSWTLAKSTGMKDLVGTRPRAVGANVSSSVT